MSYAQGKPGGTRPSPALEMTADVEKQTDVPVKTSIALWRELGAGRTH